MTTGSGTTTTSGSSTTDAGTTTIETTAAPTTSTTTSATTTTAPAEPWQGVATVGPGLSLAVASGHSGSLASMTCVDLALAQTTAAVVDVRVKLGLSHPAAGDLTVKLVSPEGTQLTVMSRPGLLEAADNGQGCCGADSLLSQAAPISFHNDAAVSAEQLAAAVGPFATVCADGDPCEFFPSSGAGPGTDLDDFAGEDPSGTWQLCVGDSVLDDAGTLDFAELSVAAAE